jgi:ribonuclease D
LAVEILEVLEKARKTPPSRYVKPEAEKKYSQGSNSLLELLKLLLKIRSQEQGVVARLIADDDELREFSAFKDKNNPLLKGWRLDIFGRDALELRDGHLSISFNKDKNCIDIKKHSAG